MVTFADAKVYPLPMSARSTGPHRRDQVVAFVIKVMRLARGLTLEDFGELSNIRPDVLWKLESGGKRLNLGQLDRMARGFGTPLESIISISSTLPETEPLDATTRAQLAAQAIDLAGAPPEAINMPKINKLLKDQLPPDSTPE